MTNTVTIGGHAYDIASARALMDDDLEFLNEMQVARVSVLCAAREALEGGAMIGLYKLDANGDPIECTDMAEFAQLFESKTARRLNSTEKNGVLVSTVFLGIDHSFGNGEPLLFETKIFGGDYDESIYRYTTRAEAEAGHKRVCEMFLGDDHD